MKGDWIAIQLDSVAAEVFDHDEAASPKDVGLGFLRIVSTRAAIQRAMDSGEPLEVGDWVEAYVDPMALEGARVWSLQLQGGRLVGGGPDGRPSKGRLVSLRRLAPASQPIDPRPLGGGVPVLRAKGSALKERFNLLNIATPHPPAAVNAHLRLRNRFWGVGRPWAYDVGQASFNAVLPPVEGDPVLYFDVGQPIWFHLHNAPSGFSPPYSEQGTVVLSHWDTDHYAYGRQNAGFHAMNWFAPAQSSVGPNAHAFARHLHGLKRLILVGPGRSSHHRRGARIIRCGGSSVNGSGLALHLRSRGRNVLLTGDAAYHEIPSMRGVRLEGVQLPHHGGRLVPTAVVPTGSGPSPRAVISCGLPNRYGHPDTGTISDHVAAGWRVEITAGSARSPRGPRPL